MLSRLSLMRESLIIPKYILNVRLDFLSGSETCLDGLASIKC